VADPAEKPMHEHPPCWHGTAQAAASIPVLRLPPCLGLADTKAQCVLVESTHPQNQQLQMADQMV
jgi:hypothetical protein